MRILLSLLIACTIVLSASSLKNKPSKGSLGGSPDVQDYVDNVTSLIIGDYWTCQPYLNKLVSLASNDALNQAFLDFEIQMEAARVNLHLSNMFVTIVYGDQVIYKKGFGLTQNNTAPDFDTLYRICSISKVWPVIALLQLRDQGIIQSLDDPIHKYIDEFTVPNPYSRKTSSRYHITWRQVATHTAGLLRESPCTAASDVDKCVATNAQMFQRLSTLDLILPPATRPSYSNLGFGLLGKAVEIIVQKNGIAASYEDYVDKFISQPLGMNNTGFNYTADVLNRLANRNNVTVDNLGWEGAAGQMYSSSRDFATFMSFVLRHLTNGFDDPSTYNAPSILDDVTVREWMQSFFWHMDGKTAFGMPWESYFYNDYLYITKGGNGKDYAADIAFVPPLNLGMTFMINGETDQTFAEVIAGNTFVPVLASLLRSAQTPPPLPPNPLMYVGVYANDDFKLSVAFTDNLLIANDGRANYYLAPAGNYTFRVIIQVAPPLAGCMVQAFFGAHGEFLYFSVDNNSVTSVKFPGYTWPDLKKIA